MDKAMGRLVLLIGTGLYGAMGVLALLTYIWHVEVFAFVTLGIVLQIVLALPVVAFLIGKAKIPVLDYAKWFLAAIVALSVSGFLGVPSGSYRYFPSAVGLKADASSIEAGDLGGREKLELMVDLAGAESDDEKKAIRKKLKAVDEGISDGDRKDAERELAVLKAKARLVTADSDAREIALFSAEKRSALMLLAAFIMFAGAWLMSRADSSRETA
ncbi:MAG: hypothetical protein V3W41_15275 [Planctomycetota bacterium]